MSSLFQISVLTLSSSPLNAGMPVGTSAVRLLILGKPLTGRSTSARTVARKFGLEYLSMDDIASTFLRDTTADSNAEDWTLCQEMKKQLLGGGLVSDTLRISVVIPPPLPLSSYHSWGSRVCLAPLLRGVRRECPL